MGALVTTGAACLVVGFWIGLNVAAAPEGYEDERGFHLGRRPKRNPGVTPITDHPEFGDHELYEYGVGSDRRHETHHRGA